MSEISFQTADLCDENAEEVSVVTPGLRSLGGRARVMGPIRTVQAVGDNSKVREAFGEPGEGSVLVVDAGGARDAAMVGDRLAALAVDNGWRGVIVHGCVRDAEILATLDLGVWAIGTHPRKTTKRDQGVRDVPLRFRGVLFVPGHYLYADADGIIVAPRRLTPG